MAKILAPNESYTGISASVAFSNGIGETEDKHLIEWFREKGYTVVEEESTSELDNSTETGEKNIDEMSVEELMIYAKEKGIDIGKSTSQEGILKKIQDSEKVE